MANFRPNQNDYNNMTPFKTWLKYQINTWGLNSFPFVESDFDDLTNYAMMMKLMKHFNILIDNQNMVEEDMTNLYNAFTELQTYLFNEFAEYKTDITEDFNELQSYVDNYFDNLDVQEEINNKLDDMVEQGTLQEIIADYLNSKAIFGFDNVASMKLSENLIDGSYAKTLGYHYKNDGGMATYKIREKTNDDTIDEATIISLHDDLIAELIGESKNVVCFGAKPNDNTFDCSIAINKAILYNKGKEIYIPSGTYYINSPIETYFSSANFTNIKMESDTKIVANNTMDYLFNMGGISESYNYEIGNKKYIKGGILESNNHITIAVINIYKYVKDLEISNVQINYENCNGIICGEINGGSQDLYIHHCLLKHANVLNSNHGIVINTPDNSIADTRVYYNNNAFEINAGGNYFNNVHTLSNDLQTNNIGFYITQGSIFLNNCYCDSEDTFIKIYNENTSIQPRIFMNNCEYYSYRQNSLTFADMSTNIARLKINNLYMSLKNVNPLHKGIICPYDRLLQILTNDYLTCNGVYIENDEYMRNGDILKGMIVDEVGKTIFRPSNDYMVQNTWYLLGYYPSHYDIWNNIDLCITNRITKVPLSLRINNSGQLRFDLGTGIVQSDDAATYEIGARCERWSSDTSSTDYPVIGLYIRITSSQNRKINDYKIFGNRLQPISKLKNIPTETLNVSTETMDQIFTLDCPNKTITAIT